MTLRTFFVPLRVYAPLRRRLNLPSDRCVRTLEVGGSVRGAFRALDPAHTEYWPAPISLPDVPLPADFREAREVIVPATGVLTLPRGRFWSHHGCSVFDADDRLVWPVSRNPWGMQLHSAYIRPSLPKITRLKGRALLLATPEATSNYHHWMVDLTPRYELVQRAGFDLKSFDWVIVNHKALSYQQLTFAAWGLDPRRIIKADDATQITADELVVPTLVQNNKIISRRAVESTRALWLNRAAQLDGIPDETPTRIYLSRRDAGFRRVLNEDAVRACLGEYGFVAVEMSRLTVAQQARVMQRAKIVVGPAGANLANILFVEPGTQVLELMPSCWVHPYNWGLAATRDADFHALIDQPERTVSKLKIENCHRDFSVNIGDLRRMLEIMLASTPAVSHADAR